MKNNNYDFFNYIDFCLKKNNIKPKSQEPSIFMLNRWLSMTNESISIILNATTNKWSKNIKKFDYISFYRKILPNVNKKINYIKRKDLIDKDENVELVNNSKLMECSIREIINYEKTIASLNIGNK